jgi:hypothetical protein
MAAANVNTGVKAKSQQALTSVKTLATITAPEKALALKESTVTLVKHPHFQTVTISTGAGAITFGAVGGAFGCAGGVVVGGAVGTLPALFTFGTSIPIGAIIGGFLGTSAAALTAGTTGACIGGAAGHGAYLYRAQIKDGVMKVRMITTDKANKFTVLVTTTTTSTKKQIMQHAMATKGKLTTLANTASIRPKEIANNQRVQVTAASAAGGAAVGGVGGGAVGAGAGALVGLPAALFTFGLSIPVCATVGGAMGATAGATTGAAAGGAAGYTGHKYKKEISDNARSLFGKARARTNQITAKAVDSVSHAKRVLVGGTGGTSE